MVQRDRRRLYINLCVVLGCLYLALYRDFYIKIPVSFLL